ncbi:MAG: DUF4157 domain-containing protein, partial [Chloroflexota bacterium]
MSASVQTHASAPPSPVPSFSFTPVRSALLQRTCGGNAAGAAGACSEGRGARPGLQRRVAEGNTSAVAPPAVHEAPPSPGRPLDPSTRAFFEPSFGHDFGRVRVHDDATSGRAAESVGAWAYTVGQDIYFAPGRWNPTGTAGKRLLAHELAHTIQQRGAATA